MRIQQLPPSVSNQIAAGEVIERPASVVKELLENALDAGATAITIELGFGGLTLIKIADNGHGIYAEDLHLAIAAHATSKISQLADLYTISTMGFRGEALASIASVSRMSIYSKPADQAHGMLLKIDEQGSHTHIFARNQGTTIEIRDLFYNTPVRKTFLKSERLEYQAIELVVKQFALSAPQIALYLHHNQKQTLQLPKANCEQSRLRRIKKLFGQAFLNDAISIHEKHEQFTLQGWISQQGYQRSQRDKQWIYLNHRLIKDKLVLQAIGQAYQELLHPGRYASCILDLTLPHDQVDINVHPTKYEVRFRDPRTIHALIVSGIANRLYTQTTTSHVATEPAMLTQAHASLEDANRVIEEDTSLLILNPQFAILRLQNSAPYLVDMSKLHHNFVAVSLQTVTHPFPQRALLVPIRLSLATSAHAYLERQRSALHNLGIQFDFIGTQDILIRTMPLNLPLLNLEQFFLCIQRSNEDHHGLIHQLIACQTFDAYNMSSIERDTLVDFCIQHWDTMLTSQTCLHLDSANCQHLMRQSRSLTQERALLS